MRKRHRSSRSHSTQTRDLRYWVYVYYLLIAVLLANLVVVGAILISPSSYGATSQVHLTTGEYFVYFVNWSHFGYLFYAFVAVGVTALCLKLLERVWNWPIACMAVVLAIFVTVIVAQEIPRYGFTVMGRGDLTLSDFSLTVQSHNPDGSTRTIGREDQANAKVGDTPG